MSRILVDQVRSNSASGDAITLDGNGKCAINATTINSLTFPTSDGSADQLIKTNGSGALSFGTVAGGIPFGQQWVMTTGFHPSSAAATVFSSNLAVKTGNSYCTVGSGTMTESSGVFTFPSTGIYRVEGFIMFRNSSDTRVNCELDIQTSTDSGSSFSRGMLAVVRCENQDYYTAYGCLQVDVTNTSTQKVRFVYAGATSIYIHGNSQNDSQTYFQFTKLGDT